MIVCYCYDVMLIRYYYAISLYSRVLLCYYKTMYYLYYYAYCDTSPLNYEVSY